MVEYSIVIPVYNRGVTIIDCLESIYIQLNNHSFEVIIVDDSTDDTPVIIDNYVKDNGLTNIVYIKNLERYGVAKSRNIGVVQSIGSYLIFLDSDDELLPGSLNHISDFFYNNQNVDILFSPIINKSGRRAYYNLGFVNKIILYDDYLAQTRWGEYLPICKTSILHQNSSFCFSEGIQGFEGILWTKLLKAGYSAFCGSEPTRLYDDIGLDRLSITSLNSEQCANRATGHMLYLMEFFKDLERVNIEKLRSILFKITVYSSLSNTQLSNVDDFLIEYYSYMDVKSKCVYKCPDMILHWMHGIYNKFRGY